MTADGNPVTDYAFVTSNYENFLHSCENMYWYFDDIKLWNLSGFTTRTTKLYGVPENLMSVIDDSLYIPTDMQSVSGVGDLSDGKVNAVGLLYSDEDLSEYP